MEETMLMLEAFIDKGYRRLYTTPHILGDFYPNTPGTILPLLEQVQAEIKVKGLAIELFAAAEYYLDDAFIAAVDANEPLLCFGTKKYVLFETAFINEPVYLRDIIFKLFSNGYTPILAHPERYQYLFDNPTRVSEIFDSGVLFQVNYLSFLNYYAPPVTRLAEYLVEQGKVHMLGSDCHKPRHLETMKGLDKNKYWKKALSFPLVNREL
jgi:tyrosine-protein phosphatase YwqE